MIDNTKASIKYHDANQTTTCVLDCDSWRIYPESKCVEIVESDRIHIIPISGSILDINLPIDKYEKILRNDLSNRYESRIDTENDNCYTSNISVSKWNP